MAEVPSRVSPVSGMISFASVYAGKSGVVVVVMVVLVVVVVLFLVDIPRI